MHGIVGQPVVLRYKCMYALTNDDHNLHDVIIIISTIHIQFISVQGQWYLRNLYTGMP